MSVFLETGHLFLRTPGGNVEDVNAMKAAGFNAIFLNVGDHPEAAWDLIRENARKAAVICGPWLRIDPEGDDFDEERLTWLLSIADNWESPVIVNAEAELKGSGKTLTSFIDAECQGYDWALSMEPWPFANVDWSPISAPVLPQCFGEQWGRDTPAVIAEWKRVGVNCVVPTFGSYGGSTPSMYDRRTPYGVYTADDCGGNYQVWGATGYLDPCKEAPEPPTNGDDMQRIGSQHGITASCNRLRDLDPGGTLLKKSGGKWPSITTLTQPVPDWKAYDKLERSLSILVADHDEMLDKQAT